MSESNSSSMRNPRIAWEGWNVLLDVNDSDCLVFARLTSVSQGTTGDEIVEALLANSATFEKKMMRNYARGREKPHDGFMCPGGWQVLVNYYKSLQAEEALQQTLLSA